MKIQKISILFSFVLFIASCKKEQVQEESATNTFRGSIMVYDEGTQEIPGNGVTVLMESSGSELGSAVTDSKGDFSIPVSKETKEFTVTFSKPGMGTYKEYYKVSVENQLQVFYAGKYINRGWDQLQLYQLGSKSTVTVNNLTAEFINNQLVIKFDVASQASTGAKSVRFLIQKDQPDLTINTVSQDVFSVGNLYNVTTGQNTFTSCKSCFADCRNYQSGDKIYLTAYGESTYTNGYLNLETGRLIFPNLNVIPNNNVVSVVIP